MPIIPKKYRGIIKGVIGVMIVIAVLTGIEFLIRRPAAKRDEPEATADAAVSAELTPDVTETPAVWPSPTPTATAKPTATPNPTSTATPAPTPEATDEAADTPESEESGGSYTEPAPEPEQEPEQTTSPAPTPEPEPEPEPTPEPIPEPDAAAYLAASPSVAAVGESITVQLVNAPGSIYSGMTWANSNVYTVTITSYGLDGVTLLANEPGSSTITATLSDGTSWSVTVYVQ